MDTERIALAGDGLTLAADRVGSAEARPVIFFHGGGQTRQAWRRTVARVAEAGFQAISVDLRGHGESDWAADGDYTIDRLASDVEAVVATCREAPVLIGASLGGLAALTFVGTRARARWPVAGLVLVDVAPRVEEEGSRPIRDFMLANPDGFASLQEAADAVARYQPHRARPSSSEGLRRNLRIGDNGRYHWHWDPRMLSGHKPFASAEQRQRLEEAARAVDVPTLLVRGQLSKVLSADGVEEFRRLVPAAAYVDVADADHMVAGDSNSAFTAVILEFLSGFRT